MNNDIELMIAWFVANKLSLNVIKTETMIFTRKNVHFPLPPILINQKPISYQYSIKFLGLTIDFELNWKDQIRKVQSKLSSACGILYTIRNKISTPISRLICLSIALPYINYCNVAWSSACPSHFQSLITTQKKLIRIMLRKNRTTPSTPLFARLKLLKYNDICQLNSILYVFKSINNFIPSPVAFESRAQGPYNSRNQEP